MNSCINSIAALTGECVGVMLSADEAKSIFLEIAREALRLASYKLPVKCKFVKKDGMEA